MITGVDFVSIPTRDIEAARRFYGEVLGLEAGPLYQRGGDPPLGAEFETGTVTLSVVDPQRMGIGAFEANRNAIALQVEDVAAARAALEARGVTFMGDIFDTGVCHMAFFADPDGNALILHHRYAPQS